MRPDYVRPVETTISGRKVRLYFLKLDDERKYQQNGSFAAVIDKVLEKPIRQGMVIFAIGPALSGLGGRISGLRIAATDARGEYDIKKAIAEYRSTDDGESPSEEDCAECDEEDCPAWQMLHDGGSTADDFPDAGTDELLGAPGWDKIMSN